MPHCINSKIYQMRIKGLQRSVLVAATKAGQHALSGDMQRPLSVCWRSMGACVHKHSSSRGRWISCAVACSHQSIKRMPDGWCFQAYQCSHALECGKCAGLMECDEPSCYVRAMHCMSPAAMLLIGEADTHTRALHSHEEYMVAPCPRYAWS